MDFFIEFLPWQLMMGLAGFTIGRIGDKWGGHMNTPHHWVPGIVLMFIGFFFNSHFWGFAFLSFGTGLFISDLNDFICFRIYGPDEKEEWKFWSIQ